MGLPSILEMFASVRAISKARGGRCDIVEGRSSGSSLRSYNVDAPLVYSTRFTPLFALEDCAYAIESIIDRSLFYGQWVGFVLPGEFRLYFSPFGCTGQYRFRQGCWGSVQGIHSFGLDLVPCHPLDWLLLLSCRCSLHIQWHSRVQRGPSAEHFSYHATQDGRRNARPSPATEVYYTHLLHA
jgi:hypothetical protein